MKNALIVTLALAGSLSLAACNRQDSAQTELDGVATATAEGQKDLADAQAEATADVADARRDEAKTQIDAMDPSTSPEDAQKALAEGAAASQTADAGAIYKIDETQIESAYRVQKERCETYAAKEKNDCLDRAKSDYEQQLKVAKAKRDASEPEKS